LLRPTIGSITGTINDSTGAVVPNAPVEVANQTTGTIYRGGASATGNFIVANLPAGQYTLSVTVMGFKKYLQRELNRSCGALYAQRPILDYHQ
jgi:hypothetical protein